MANGVIDWHETELHAKKKPVKKNKKQNKTSKK